MTVIRRLDAVLEPTKQQVLDLKKQLDEANIADQTGPLQGAAGQQFYNASPFTLRDLRSATSQQQLRDNFNVYLDGFSPNVQDILEKFEFRNQTARLSNGGVLDALIERFLTPTVNFSPNPIPNEDETVRIPGLDNHAMGSIFEDLIRRFNEENNEEAGEHWTPPRRRGAHGQAGVSPPSSKRFSQTPTFSMTERSEPEGCSRSQSRP